MILDSRRLMEHSCLWFLTNRPRPLDCAATITQFGAGVETLTGCLESVLPADQAAALESRSARLREAGVPEGLAGVIGGIAPLASACDIVDVAARATLPVADVARTYFQIGARLGLEWLRGCAGSVQTQTHWQRQAVASIIEDLYGQQRAVAARVVASEGAGSGAVDSWIGNNQAIISRNEALFTDLRSGDRLDLAMLAVANRQMRSLIAG
jgi:glutamate dehydrogenase